MTTIASTGSTGTPTTTPAAAGPAAKTGTAALGFSDYISLLTTQLKYQDPTAPTDNSQMVAQMAQFSTLSGISSLNTTASAIQSDLATLGTLNTSLTTISTKLDSILSAQKSATTA